MCALPGSAAPCNLWGTNMGLLCMCVCVCVCVCVRGGGGLAALSGSLAPMPKHA